jgi:hypothetical protein
MAAAINHVASLEERILFVTRKENNTPVLSATDRNAACLFQDTKPTPPFDLTCINPRRERARHPVLPRLPRSR